MIICCRNRPSTTHIKEGKCPDYPSCKPTQLCGDKSAWQDLATFENCIPIHCEALDKAPEV